MTRGLYLDKTSPACLLFLQYKHPDNTEVLAKKMYEEILTMLPTFNLVVFEEWLSTLRNQIHTKKFW